MPALIDIRRRIRSVKNTQQITKALKMVSAAKLRRAQESMFAARPYARTMAQVLKDVAARAEGEENHPLFRTTSKEGRVLVVVVTSDKGLCGAFNSSLLRVSQRFLADNTHREVLADAVGRKGRDFLKRRTTIRKEYIGVFQALAYFKAQEIAQSAMKAFLDREVDEVVLLFNEFKSVIQQRIVTQRLLPLEALEEEKASQDYLYEPNPRSIFDKLLPKIVETTVWQALLESNAAEHGARMAAMDSATRNASETIDKLTLYMNKVRQAAITKEIIEVVSGSAA
ncbi:MAG: ATP synthase F1 subunit gamma [Vicinamibacteria bacterium]|nr:ATP synthase F1 subunit gamma [Vicinamibacteria bacterium]